MYDIHGVRDVVAPRFVAADIGSSMLVPPASVLSPAAYNDKTNLVICCPMATQIKNYPFEVRSAGDPSSVVLADQLKSLDWRVRKARRKGVVSPDELAEVRAKIMALIG